MKTVVIIVIYLGITLLAPSSLAASNFYDERYRGWLWYEDRQGLDLRLQQKNKQKQHNQPNRDQRNSDITPDQAKAEIEQFAKELEALKFVMLARPSPENVRAYRAKEQVMWERATKLHDAWNMANLLYPEQLDLLQNPLNVHALKVKREMENSDNDQKIRSLAKEFDLVLFFSPDCRYCQLFSPVLKDFGGQYGFNIEAIASDGSEHEYFSSGSNPELTAQLIEKLGIEAFPTLIAVSRDGKTIFELIRGYVTISELREYSLLAVQYLKEQKSSKSDHKNRARQGQ